MSFYGLFINDIARQANSLAFNATVDVGCTPNDISRQIMIVQRAAAYWVEAVRESVIVIEQINELTDSIATAVDEFLQQAETLAKKLGYSISRVLPA